MLFQQRKEEGYYYNNGTVIISVQLFSYAIQWNHSVMGTIMIC